MIADIGGWQLARLLTAGPTGADGGYPRQHAIPALAPVVVDPRALLPHALRPLEMLFILKLSPEFLSASPSTEPPGGHTLADQT